MSPEETKADSIEAIKKYLQEDYSLLKSIEGFNLLHTADAILESRYDDVTLMECSALQLNLEQRIKA